MSFQSTSQGTGDLRSRLQSRPGRPPVIEKAQNPRRALARLLPYLKPFKLKIGIVLIFVVLYTLLGLAGPYLMGVAIDKFVSGKDAAGLEQTALLMLAAYLLNNLFQALANWLMAKVSQDALKQLRRDLFQHLQTLSIAFYDTNPAGGVMSRLTNDIDAINQVISQNIISLIASILTLGGILIMMFLLNAWLALSTLLVVPIMMWFTSFVAKYTRKGFRELQKNLGGLNSVAEEAISGQKVIKAFRRNETVIEAFRKKNQAVYKAGVYANTYSLLIMPPTNVLGNFFVIVLASLGGWLALRNLVSVGMIATFINYGQNYVSPLRQLANLYNSIQAALAGAERVFEIMDTPSEIQDAADALPLETIRGDVNFTNVKFGYLPQTPIIKDLTLKRKRAKVALVGPRCRKNHDLNLLTRFYEIQGGEIPLTEWIFAMYGRQIYAENWVWFCKTRFCLLTL